LKRFRSLTGQLAGRTRFRNVLPTFYDEFQTHSLPGRHPDRRLTTLARTCPKRNGCLKRDRQLSLRLPARFAARREPARTPPSTSLFLPMKLSNSLREPNPQVRQPARRRAPRRNPPNPNPQPTPFPLPVLDGKQKQPTLPYPLLSERAAKVSP
jgi:hypothetical protein